MSFLQTEADLTPFAQCVLAAARHLASVGLYPSGPRLGARMGISAHAGMEARDALLACVEAGLYVMPPRTYTPAVPQPRPRRLGPVPDGPCGVLVAQYRAAWRNVRRLLEPPVVALPKPVAVLEAAPPVAWQPGDPLPQHARPLPDGRFEARFSFKSRSYRAGLHATPEAAHRAARAKLAGLQARQEAM